MRVDVEAAAAMSAGLDRIRQEAGVPDAFPDGELHRRYREEYNIRPALRLIRPLYDEAPARRSAP